MPRRVRKHCVPPLAATGVNRIVLVFFGSVLVLAMNVEPLPRYIPRTIKIVRANPVPPAASGRRSMKPPVAFVKKPSTAICVVALVVFAVRAYNTNVPAL